MEHLKSIVLDIHDELCGAIHYAKLGAKMKHEGLPMADSYVEMAEQELGHARTLCDMAKEYIAACDNPEDHKYMATVWQWEHELMVEDDAKAVHTIEMAKD